MPVNIKRDPFSGKLVQSGIPLTTPEARLLVVINPEYPEDPVFDWPIFDRTELCKKMGSSLLSMAPNRALNGVREGSSSGEARPGLLIRKLVEEVVLTIEGVKVSTYRITHAGIVALKSFLSEHGGKIPPKRASRSCVNKRYRKDTDSNG